MLPSDAPEIPDISISLPHNSDRVPVIHVPSLPAELLEQINKVYLLHALATNASRILPPGKSLISLLSSRTRRKDVASDGMTKSLKEQVSDVAMRAFWDEALESLSSSMPSVQLTRLSLLYEDLRMAVIALVPSTHPIIYTLSNPMSPTSSPLRSAAGHLGILLSVLRERCAPMRDADVDTLIDDLRDRRMSDLPQVIINVARGIFTLTDVMKDDLADYVVGTWTEQEIQQWIRREALDRERRTVMATFSAKIVEESYREWLGSDSQLGVSGTDHLVDRLMETLSFPEPVSSFPPSGNMLPPQFLFVAFDLVKIQNSLQALVITASLRSLVNTVDPPENWVARLWTLLEAEVEKGGSQPAETTLLNLEDEVVRAAGALGDKDLETRLREAVQRTLKTKDPVFVLLQRRLMMAIRQRLAVQPDTSLHSQIPAHMRTGRGRLMDATNEEEPDLIVKGFEVGVLRENIKRVAVSLRDCLSWMDHTWGSMI